MQNSGVAWRLLGWGLGAFQQCKIEPVLKSIDGVPLILPNDVSLITQGEEIEIGLILSPTSEDAGVLEEFRQYKDRLQLEVDIVDDNGAVINRHAPLSTCHAAQPVRHNNAAEGHHLGGNHYYIFRRAALQIPDRFVSDCGSGSNDTGIPPLLSMAIHLSVDTSQGRTGRGGGGLTRMPSGQLAKPTDDPAESTNDAPTPKPDQKPVADSSGEQQVRALLDAHRFQPPRIPPRKTLLPVAFVAPLRVCSWARMAPTAGQPAALLHVCLTNTHTRRDLALVDLQLYLQHSYQCGLESGRGHGDNDCETDSAGAELDLCRRAVDADALFSATHLLSFLSLTDARRLPPPGHDADGLVALAPGETHTLVYRLTPRAHTVGLDAGAGLIEVQTPVLASYAHCDLQRYNRTAEGDEAAAKVGAACSSLLHVEACALWFAIAPNTSHLSAPSGPLELEVCVSRCEGEKGPARVAQTVTLSVSVNNRAAREVNLVLCTVSGDRSHLHALPPAPPTGVESSAALDTNSTSVGVERGAVFQEDFVSLLGVRPGAVATTTLRLVPLHTGLLTLSCVRIFDLQSK